MGKTKLVLYAIFFSSFLLNSTNAQERFEATQIKLNPNAEAAFQAWLKGDDATTYPTLLQLATQGDEDAMLLLGLFRNRDMKISNYINSLSGKIRKQYHWSELNGKRVSWLDRIEGKHKKLAQELGIITPLNGPLRYIENYLFWHEKGEIYRNEELLNRVTGLIDDPILAQKIIEIGYDEQNLFQYWWFVINSPRVDKAWVEQNPSSKPLPMVLFHSWTQKRTDLDGLAFAKWLGQKRIDSNEFPQVKKMGGTMAFLQHVLNSHADAAPIRNICDAICPQQENLACLHSIEEVSRVTAAYLRSPLLSLVSQEEYEKSNRFEISLKSSWNSLLGSHNPEFNPYNQCVVTYLDSDVLINEL